MPEPDYKIDLTVGGYLFHYNQFLLVHHKKLGLWLPVGGHIETNETPDQALRREFREELNLDVTILGKPTIPLAGDAKENLALPFHVNIHSVGNHDHCCFYYVCNTKNIVSLEVNSELEGYGWFSENDINQKKIPEDHKHIASEAFRCYRRIHLP